MSPSQDAVSAQSFGFPRVSGDEPTPDGRTSIHLRFSPRERG